MGKTWNYFKNHAVSTFEYVAGIPLIIDGAFRNGIYLGNWEDARTEVELGIILVGKATGMKIYENRKIRAKERYKNSIEDFSKLYPEGDVDKTIESIASQSKRLTKLGRRYEAIKVLYDFQIKKTKLLTEVKRLWRKEFRTNLDISELAKDKITEPEDILQVIFAQINVAEDCLKELKSNDYFSSTST